MILLAYDGSPDARAAIDHAARLLPGAEVTVLTVWESFPSPTGGAMMEMGAVYVDPVEVDQANEEAAREQARDGADRATAAGLRAQACTARSIAGADAAILAAAARINADAIVMGTRGLTRLKSFFLEGPHGGAEACRQTRPCRPVKGGRQQPPRTNPSRRAVVTLLPVLGVNGWR